MPLNRIEKTGQVLFRDHVAANIGADKYLVGEPFPKGVKVDEVKISLSRRGLN